MDEFTKKRIGKLLKDKDAFKKIGENLDHKKIINDLFEEAEKKGVDVSLLDDFFDKKINKRKLIQWINDHIKIFENLLIKNKTNKYYHGAIDVLKALKKDIENNEL